MAVDPRITRIVLAREGGKLVVVEIEFDDLSVLSAAPPLNPSPSEVARPSSGLSTKGSK